MKPRKTLSNWLNSKYLLIIRNEENFAEKTTFHYTNARLILFLFLIFLIMMVSSLFLSRTLMAKWFDPGHELIILDRQLVQLADKVDSLDNQVRIKEQFIKNIQQILMGKTIDDDSLIESENKPPVGQNVDRLTPIDSQFRKEFEKTKVGFLTVTANNPVELEQYFFPPIDGIVTRKFNLKTDHYGVDIVSKNNEPVKAVADGAVIFADWSQESGNVIAIQHRGDLVSVYKHNSALLKKVGTFVHAGDVIAIIGNSGELTTGPHLHFELWFKGNPVDPEEFISFD